MRHHLALTTIAAALACAPAAAATYTVTRYDDPLPNGCQVRDCSLREAAMAADATAAADTIALSSGTYVLTRGGAGDSGWIQDLDFSQEFLTIQGAGSGATRIRSLVPVTINSDGRLIQAWGGALTLKGLTLEHGRQGTSAAEPRGGCLYVALAFHVVLNDVVLRNCDASEGGAAMLSVNETLFEDVVVESNHAYRGGGIWLPAGTHHWKRVVVRNNSADTDGGGLLFSNGADATLYVDGLSRFADNIALRGGAIAIVADDVFEFHGDSAASGVLTQIAGNVADIGGAIHVSGGAELTMDHFAIVENRATRGAGINTWNSRLVVSDVELLGNAADDEGGGMLLSNRAHELRRVSFTRNEAATEGGGLYAAVVEDLLLENVSFAGNIANSGGGMRTIVKPGSVTLRNTSFGGNLAHAANNSAGMSVVGPVGAASSWFGDGCPAGVASLGGNAQVTGSPTCGLGPFDVGFVAPADARVSFGDFGGAFDILGFDIGSTLKDAAHPAPCALDDARSVPRVDGRCDVGAYEAQ